MKTNKYTGSEKENEGRTFSSFQNKPHYESEGSEFIGEVVGETEITEELSKYIDFDKAKGFDRRI